MILYNTHSERLEDFQPKAQPVTVYVCGITPYDTTYLGHAFTYAAMDHLIRHLEYQGHTVRYVQNVTDIDDDILRRAAKVGEDWRALGDRWTAHFIEDMQALNVRPPDYFPHATDVIPQIVEAVQELIETGVAYVASGNVYYAVQAYPDYGKLSHLAPTEMLATANERGNDPHDPLDFVLWQA
jgi:L-cysteine:1D-myo-inositol 2-amino-2-deoxy-alpha-D-glucopyranoside ligase